VKARLEHAETADVVRWLRAAGIMFAAIPNGARTSISVAKRLKAEGMVSGAPDLLIFDPPPAYPQYVGSALEMKRVKGGNATPEQRAFHAALVARRWLVIVGKGAAAALAALAQAGYRVPR
jgi:hypothetical protein